ncbi:HisA/HisF-related TIM barrel protein [Pleionea mediterranea]|uniref:1-(5-phosphoribosyl)-5-[(5-phosphoribosylamino)methylideneamino] imidazole-4-carboxamide isomerase n=1 Tax=Pleionea mediterranea TaxID=523701 RepID=A0A316FWB5_9GAMM|nr:HisA/HisF-related TIM barrel protein [Pleionea mediterranea]PWK52981.1 1-(5-phosphoribosyl)-5-[(5-phosphoribosylamino)methylideneamino] imidazole-4-carboxamide isomerase [Pleionea mediterranea]
MLAIPVIDVKSGRCVHTQGVGDKSKQVMEDPIALCGTFSDMGARQIQLVDMDAIRNRQPEHLSLVQQIKRQFPDMKLQVSGGVCSSEDIQIWLDAGADWVTLGGRLLRKQDEMELILVELGQNLIIGMDVRAQLWQQGYCPFMGMSFQDWAQALEDEGVAALMFTEVPEQGRVNGHSLTAASELAASINLPVIAHGGVQSVHDLKNLSQPGYHKLHGVTLGKPMFDGFFSYHDAISMLKH